MPTRRRLLRLGLAASLGVAGCSQPADPGTGTTRDVTDWTATTTSDTDGLPVELETVTDTPDSPLAFAETPEGTYYIADRPGRVYLLGDTTELALDLTDAIRTGSERGLLGFALHPAFESTRRVYVRYSAPPRDGTPDSYSHTFVLAEFRARPDGSIDRESERTVLEIPEPQGNHNSGPIAFGPDGLLYIGVGDGGGGGDRGAGHVADWYEGVDGGNGQDVTENLLGSLLRIDVDARTGDRPYGIPEDNPLVGKPGLDEHYAWGLRNPWGISFDGEDLYVADVGQNRFEEVNRVEAGGNYGWNVREGTHCYGAESCPETAPGGKPLQDPVIEYPHADQPVAGVSVIGGHVYRGEAIPELDGRYVFGDLQARGRLFVATPVEDGLWPTEVLDVAASSQDALRTLLGIGRDRADELYVLTPGGVHRVVASA